MAKEVKSISELKDNVEVNIIPTSDHFIVRLSQEDIDNEIKRLKVESKAIESNFSTKNKMQVKGSKDVFKIENHVNHRVMTVYSVGSKCEEVKPGDKVLVRMNSNPEEVKFGEYLYLSYSEKTISGILKSES
jgi:hypothetical protein